MTRLVAAGVAAIVFSTVALQPTVAWDPCEMWGWFCPSVASAHGALS